jgi:hypothetical protein
VFGLVYTHYGSLRQASRDLPAIKALHCAARITGQDFTCKLKQTVTGIIVKEVFMTDEVLVPDASASNAPSTPAPAMPSASPEDAGEPLLPQSKVNQLIGRIKTDAYEKGRREALSTQPRADGMVNLTPEEIQRQIDERVNHKLSEREQEQQRLQQEQQRLQVAQGFLQKLSPGEQKYSDFTTMVSPTFLENFARTATPVFHMVNALDNTADVMYELAKNPEKAIQPRNSRVRVSH